MMLRFASPFTPFVPAQAGTQKNGKDRIAPWVPAFAGTNGEAVPRARLRGDARDNLIALPAMTR